MSVIQLVFNDTYEGWRWKKFIFVLMRESVIAWVGKNVGGATICSLQTEYKVLQS